MEHFNLRYSELNVANCHLIRPVASVDRAGLGLDDRRHGAGHPLCGSWMVCQHDRSIRHSDGGLGASAGHGRIPIGGSTSANAPACNNARACTAIATAFRPGGFLGGRVGHVDVYVAVAPARRDRVRALRRSLFLDYRLNNRVSSDRGRRIRSRDRIARHY